MRLRSMPLAWGLSLLGLFAFLMITRRLLGAEVDALDRSVLLALGRCRTPWLSHVAVDVTSLGSPTLVTLATVVVATAALLSKDRLLALQVPAVAAGGGVLTHLIKHLVERPRPTVLSPLVTAEGFSFPSGHTLSAAALYLFLGWAAAARATTRPARLFLLGAALGIALAVGVSRMYLGVHYPSDVLGALCLGFSWAQLVIGLGQLGARGWRLPVAHLGPDRPPSAAR